VLEPGDRVPQATVFRNPGEPVSLDELVHDGPALLFFYLFDWSST
jgi:peroxiredoxin